MKTILASKSPRRRELIGTILEDVEFADSNADESVPESLTVPEEVAIYLAEKKAASCRSGLDEPEESLIIGCDTIVALDDEIFGKPKDAEDAYRILRDLSGRDHTVVTGVCLLGPNKKDSFAEVTLVKFADLSDEDIDGYIKTGDPFDKAGAYGIQNVPKNFIEKVTGDYNNVVGLPTKALKEHIEAFNSNA